MGSSFTHLYWQSGTSTAEIMDRFFGAGVREAYLGGITVMPGAASHAPPHGPAWARDWASGLAFEYRTGSERALGQALALAMIADCVRQAPTVLDWGLSDGDYALVGDDGVVLLRARPRQEGFDVHHRIEPLATSVLEGFSVRALDLGNGS
ncbi:MAG: hypothetical protein H0W72_13335 [Planctomycetes bacterium]|nr:hypothetical protein [Planctomycetota bacterium]